MKKITDLALIPVLQILLLPVRGLKRNVGSDKIRQPICVVHVHVGTGALACPAAAVFAAATTTDEGRQTTDGATTNSFLGCRTILSATQIL